MAIKRYDVQIIGTSSTGNTYRAADTANSGVIYNIPVSVFTSCQVVKADGSTGKGLADGSFYTLAADMNPSPLADGGVIYILTPVKAKEMVLDIDFDQLEMDAPSANARERSPLGTASEKVQTKAPAAEDEEAPF